MHPTISLDASGGFLLHLPTPHSEGQHILIPFSLTGLQVLRRVLRNREAGIAKIGNDSSPIQSMIDQWLRAAERDEREEAKRKLAASPITVDLDLDLEL